MNPRIGWGQPPPGWQAPGWAPLVDPGPRPLQAARSVGRWWWPTLTMAGFLAVLAYVVDHDPASPGLSSRGLLTVALAATVALLAALLAAPAGTVDHRRPTTPTAAKPQPRPRPARTSPRSSGP